MSVRARVRARAGVGLRVKVGVRVGVGVGVSARARARVDLEAGEAVGEREESVEGVLGPFARGGGEEGRARREAVRAVP